MSRHVLALYCGQLFNLSEICGAVFISDRNWKQLLSLGLSSVQDTWSSNQIPDAAQRRNVVRCGLRAFPNNNRHNRDKKGTRDKKTRAAKFPKVRFAFLSYSSLNSFTTLNYLTQGIKCISNYL